MPVFKLQDLIFFMHGLAKKSHLLSFLPYRTKYNLISLCELINPLD
jgi:hypothetical protein